MPVPVFFILETFQTNNPKSKYQNLHQEDFSGTGFFWGFIWVARQTKLVFKLTFARHFICNSRFSK